MRAVTLAEVARHAGVSQATASRVLNGSLRVPGPGVADAVKKAADELGYVANAQAQALARSTTGLIGLIVHDIADPYFSTIASGVQRAARLRQRQVLLACTERSIDQEREAVTAFISHRPDALILVGSRRAKGDALHGSLDADFNRYTDHGGRIAVVGQARPQAHSVVPQNLTGAGALAHALVEQGHRRFAILSGPLNFQTSLDRTAGFVEALAAHGLSPLASVDTEFTRDGGYDGVRTLIDQLGLGDEPICIFAVNDVMALGAIAGLRAAGLRVPDDVQVAGFDDIPTLRDYEPALTTVSLPLAEMGRLAVEFVLDAQDGNAPGNWEAPGTVVLRDSTRLPG